LETAGSLCCCSEGAETGGDDCGFGAGDSGAGDSGDEDSGNESFGLGGEEPAWGGVEGGGSGGESDVWGGVSVGGAVGSAGGDVSGCDQGG
jgi:hypothetical protein